MSETTRRLARYIVESRFETLPEPVRREGPRAFLNWLGCVLGGCKDPSVDTAEAALAEYCGPPQATVIGRGRRVDIISAAFFNCLSSSSQAYDDTHLATIAHPTGVTAAGMLAVAERRAVSGRDFLHALILGIEVQCRISKVLVAPPARSAVGMFMTGFTGAMGAAAAVGRLLGLDEQRMVWALGIAATQGGGFRETHGTMTVGFVRAHAARCGLVAALLAEKGFTCSEQSLESPRGFAAYAAPPNLDAATDRLGQHFEVLGNAYKPYACAIVVHPAIDVSLEFAPVVQGNAAVVRNVELTVHPLAVELSGRTDPVHANEARISVSHWAAATMLYGKASLRKTAGLDADSDGYVRDPVVVALRRKIRVSGDPSLGRDEARGSLELENGRLLKVHVEHCRGSLARPMTDDELNEKFRDQALTVLPAAKVDELLAQCWRLGELENVGALVQRFF